jgi:single-strand DNA-binding protein
MANEPVITIVGNTGSEAELRFTPSGAAVSNFSVCVTPRVKQGDQWVDGDATWYRVNAWRQLAENCAESIGKGMRVIVQGRLSNRKYTTPEGDVRYSLEITADAVGPDLQWATARVVKPERSQGGGYDQGGQQRQQSGGGQYANQGGQRRQAPQNDDPWGSAPASQGGGAGYGGGGGFTDEPPFHNNTPPFMA